jgi:hypothetical protein
MGNLGDALLKREVYEDKPHVVKPTEVGTQVESVLNNRLKGFDNDLTLS